MRLIVLLYLYSTKESTDEKRLAYQREKLLKDRVFINNQMRLLSAELNRVDNILSFIDTKYHSELFSKTINKQVEEDKNLNTKLEEYIRKRSVTLNELVLLKEANLNIESALKHISGVRTYLRNQFRFEKNNVLWRSGAWGSAFNMFAKNTFLVLKDCALFFVLLGLYLLARPLFSLDRYLFKNPKIRNKKKILQAAVKLNRICFFWCIALSYIQ
ncbi:hypothetical protein [Francisella orientalis]|uniref:hypothetical protein n=1 Tax=Francisella orientalis TaxID=299583 RepID=UPI0011ECAD43|nr:hypothetical protein [Francisella orientalis]